MLKKQFESKFLFAFVSHHCSEYQSLLSDHYCHYCSYLLQGFKYHKSVYDKKSYQHKLTMIRENLGGDQW